MSIETHSDDPTWLPLVRAGIFEALPDPLNWEDTPELAHFIDGYVVSEVAGLGSLRIWANVRAEAANETESWSGTALELWCCLFYEHRRYRHFGEDPTGQDRYLLHALCSALRRELVGLPTADRAEITRLFIPLEPPQP
ncbi:hypothetical protein U0C82_06820 [Fulvimarina sp. 2208YS6-2-32]|uniref:Uncharacterized protein n=1 Tax=Fulvimarina uroteuthidis TaxID=3098149 RepID=A0ABU5I0D7_9HYPH|nr:hypothetical protein [Fulvimarina sp. 2208YS6-2-32]MDY8108856.1 hypothetical protein [Fulvimarina sp. 2208YS6-2-32]